MIVTKDSPIFDQVGGLHHIYVNEAAFPTLKAGGLFPSILTDRFSPTRFTNSR